MHLTSDGNWLEVRRPAGKGAPAPALFLDRDGVVVEERHYLSKPDDVLLVPGAEATIAAANGLGWSVVMVTNQSGIGRGYFGWKDFAAVQHRICADLSAHGAEIDMVLACAHHAEAEEPYRHPQHNWRKPLPGMLHTATEHLPIDLSRSWIVGDHVTDVRAGKAAGLAGAFHVLTGYGAKHRAGAEHAATAAFRVIPVAHVGDVRDHIERLARGG